MNRIAITLMLMLLTVALLGCGGGGAGAPAPDDGNSAIDDNPVVMPVGPSEVVGSHSTSVLPDQLNVLTGASAQALSAQLGKFGISVLSKSGGWATVELPAGMDLDWAAAELKKEYNIAKAEKINVLHTPRVSYPAEAPSRNASFTPTDPMYAMYFQAPGHDGTSWGYYFWFGQETAMNPMGFEGAWEVGLNPGVAAREVRVAIIDAGFFDYDAWDGWRDIGAGTLDVDHSGSIATDGTATTGLPAAEWDTNILINDDADPPIYYERPYRHTGELMLGLLADGLGDGVTSYGNVIYPPLDMAEDGIDSSDFWNEGIAGVNPNATYILIKTGQLGGGDTWEFTDNHIAQAIKYAAGASDDDNGGLWPNGGCEADIILLGMFAEGEVAGVVSNEIQAARDSNALVISPAGDVIASAQYDAGGEFTGWGETPVDIGTTAVTPASDPNVIAVCATGPNRVEGENLGQITYDETDYDNTGRGWHPSFADPFNQDVRTVPSGWANQGGNIAAVGFGQGYSWHPIWVMGSGTSEDPQLMFPGYQYNVTFNRFGAAYAAAYVAGAASIVHQALHEANNAEPSDEDVWQVLVDTMQYAPMTGVADNGGMLNASAAAMNAMAGGTLYQPSMYLDGVVVSQLPNYVEIETDFEMTPTVQLGTAPFTIRVAWDNGEDEVEQVWDNSTPVTLTGGWDTLGLKGINLEIEDADGQLVTFELRIHVVGRLGAGITINDVNGALVLPSTLQAGLNYRFNANPTNVYTGEIDGEPNVTTFSWDFDGDATEDATGVSPAYGYPAAGDYTLQLLVTETVRPSIIFTMDVNVN